MDRSETNFGGGAARRAEQRLRGGRKVAIGGLLAAASALALLVAPGAAGAERTPEGPPPSAILGGWQVTGNRVLADGGATTYHYERDPAAADGSVDIELQWHRGSAAEVGQQLEAQGYTAAGTLPTCVTDQRKVQENDWENVFTKGIAQAYVVTPQAGQTYFQAVGVWEEDGYTYALSASVNRLYMMERFLERVERLDGSPTAGASTTKRRHAKHHHKHRRRRHDDEVAQATGLARWDRAMLERGI